jgi:threonyl-tRNA synthetase
VGREIAETLKDAGLRVEVDTSGGRMQAKIRNAQLQKVPYMLVLGKREAEAGTVAVRLRSGEDLGAMPVQQFLDLVLPVVETKSLSLTESRQAGEKSK